MSTRGSRWIGGIRISPPRVGWIAVGLAVSICLAACSFVLLGSYVRHVRASGSLVPEAGLVVAASPVAGNVKRLFVREGDIVKLGDPIAEISGELDSESLGSMQAAVARQVAMSSETLREDITHGANLAIIDQQSLEARIDGLRAQRKKLDAQISIQTERARSANELYQKWIGLGNSGVVSKNQLLQQKDTALQGEAQLQELLSRGSDMDAQLAQAQASFRSAPLRRATEENETRRRLVELSSIAANNAASASTLLRASVGGAISTVTLHPGQHVTANQTVVTIFPAGSRLVAELWVSPSSVAFVQRGTQARLRYDAFPFQRYGIATGKVLAVSRNALPAIDVERATGSPAASPMYRIDIAIDAQPPVIGTDLRGLLPGMTLSADLVLQRQRILDALFEPMSDVGQSVRPAVP